MAETQEFLPTFPSTVRITSARFADTKPRDLEVLRGFDRGSHMTFLVVRQTPEISDWLRDVQIKTFKTSSIGCLIEGREDWSFERLLTEIRSRWS